MGDDRRVTRATAAAGKGVLSPLFVTLIRHLYSSLVLISGAALAPVAAAQQYPTKPVRFIVPFPPGGGNDIVGRIIAQHLQEALGQSVVVDNRGGAGGTIGTDLTAKAPADGHTMLVNNISLAVNATLIPKLPYDTLKDLAPVSIIGRQPNIVVVHPSVSAKSVREFLDLARAKPGQINYGSGGIGTASHLATELLQLTTKVQMTHVPYKGLGPALTDLIGGRLQMIISTLASALPQVKAGKLRPLAVTTVKRSAFFPDVPTMMEAGVPGYEFTTWYALVVPAGTPKAIIARLESELARIAGSGTVREQFSAQGLETAHTTSEDARAYLRSEVEKWGKVIIASGAKPE
jgi:tripartite-type tricarboxylate transporter receptor subunit TctC